MDPTQFIDSPFGSPHREPGNKWAFWYYQPKLIPRSLELGTHTILALSEADAALGLLAGLTVHIDDPHMLIGPYLTREALASSRIEGTQASMSDVMQAQVSGGSGETEDIREVTRYLAASRRAFELLDTLPITQRLILDVHEVLLRGVRGEERNPGEFRTTPVWVGSAGASPEEAVFVPPLADQLPDLLTDWEKFVNEQQEFPVLIQAALMHYQFETIHPFLDGNGRIGRLLIGLLLKEKKRLEHPLLYLSHYFETHRERYYLTLQDVREKGDIQGWLQFFLEAVKHQSFDGVRRARQLITLRETYLEQAVKTRTQLPQLVKVLMQNPFLTVRTVREKLELSNQGARNLILRAQDQGWIISAGHRGRGAAELWLCRDLLRIMESPMSYEE